MNASILRPHLGRLAALLLLLQMAIAAHAQIQWQTNNGSTDDESYVTGCNAPNGWVIATTSNGGVSGNKTTAPQGDYDAWVTLHDVSGNIQWQKGFGGSLQEWPASIQPTAGGGYLMLVYSMSGISGDKTEPNRGPSNTGDYWLIKLDAAGNLQWQKTYGGSGDDYPISLSVLPNGSGYLLGGYSASPVSGEKTQPSAGDYDFWTIKTDLNGNIVWDKTYGFDGQEVMYKLQATSDGGCIMAGSTYLSTNSGLPNYGVVDMLVIKTDANGLVTWQQTYGGSGEDYAFHILEHSDGNFVITGGSGSPISGVKTVPYCGGNYDVWSLKISTTGSIIWQNHYGTNGWDTAFHSQETPDGGILFFCNSDGGINGTKNEPNRGGTDYWLVKTNSVGNVEWQRTIGGASYENVYWGNMQPDGSILVAGISDSGVSGDKTTPLYGLNDVWLVNLGSAVAIAAPTTTNLTLCQNTVAAPLTANGQNLLWYTTPTGGVGDPIAPVPSTAAAGTTTYYVSQSANGVESPRTPLIVTVQAAPTAAASGNTTRCTYSGNTTISTNNNPAWQYAWSNGSTNSFIAVAPAATTTYTVTVTNAAGCTATSSFTLTVVTVNAQINGPNSFCKNVPTTLTATGGTSYLWSTGHQSASITQSISTPRTYTVTVTQTGCIATATKYVTVDQPFTAQITGLNSSYPQNAPPVTLTGTPAGGSFTIDNIPATVLNPATLSLGFHTVRYTVTQGACTAVRNKVVAINAPTSNLPGPEPMLVTEALDTDGDEQADWGQGDVDARNQDTEVVQPVPNIQVFPNPAYSLVFLDLTDFEGTPVELAMYNALGQLVLTQNLPEISDGIQQLDVAHLPAGMYYVLVSNPGRQAQSARIVIGD